jgi:hypothetical protein
MVGAVKDYDARLRMIGVVEKAGERARIQVVRPDQLLRRIIFLKRTLP